MAADGSSDQPASFSSVVCGGSDFDRHSGRDSFQSVWLHHLNLPITKTEQVVNMLRPALELPIGYPQSTVRLSGTSPEGPLSVSSTRLPRHFKQPDDTTRRCLVC